MNQLTPGAGRLRGPGRHLIIAGTGRAGTTALVQLLDACGLETNRETLEYFFTARAGLEQRIGPRASYVVKNPYLSEDLAGLLATGIDARDIDAVIVPIRELDSAVASRLDIFRREGLGAAGGLWRNRRPTQQPLLLAQAVHQLLYTCENNGIPVLMLGYPRFVNDPTYAWGRLQPVLGALEESSFVRLHQDVIRKDLVSSDQVYRYPEIVRLDARWALLSIRAAVARRVARTRRLLVRRRPRAPTRWSSVGARSGQSS